MKVMCPKGDCQIHVSEVKRKLTFKNELYAKNIRTRTGKMAQLPKCLLSEQENLSSDRHQKLGGEASTAILALGRQNRRVPGLAGQLVLPNW